MRRMVGTLAPYRSARPLLMFFLMVPSVAPAFQRSIFAGARAYSSQFTQYHATNVFDPDRSAEEDGSNPSRNFLSVKSSLEMYYQSRNATQEFTNTVRFVDGSWYHKGKRNGRLDYLQGPRIPDSVFFDIDDIAMTKDLFPQLNPLGLSHMQPPPELFAAYMDAGQIQSSDTIVIYGTSTECPFLSRVWCTFRHIMGHSKVWIMNGSIEDWIAMGGPVDTSPLSTSSITPAKDLVLFPNDLSRYKYQVPAYNPNFLLQRSDLETMVTAMTKPSTGAPSNILLVDTRGSSFHTEGHIPQAIHVPYSAFHQPSQPLRFHDTDTIRNVLAKYGIIREVPSPTTTPVSGPRTIVLSCGSGVSVCNVVLALDECGYLQGNEDDIKLRIYDGSWDEWSKTPHVPKTFPKNT